ncbi:hypothetical protein ACOSP7_014049 [Xanthoceras sorbifolium]
MGPIHKRNSSLLVKLRLGPEFISKILCCVRRGPSQGLCNLNHVNHICLDAIPPSFNLVIPAGPSLHRQPPPHLASSSSSLPRQPPHLAISVVADFIARVVFDAAPTLEEAKDATADLKEALDRVYLSSPESAAYQNGGTFKDGPAFGLPLHANTDNLEIKSCISCDSKLTSVPAPAFNVFKLLSESPKVQV